jgi:hypothetical protein
LPCRYFTSAERSVFAECNSQNGPATFPGYLRGDDYLGYHV